MKKIIGIVPASFTLESNESCTADYYKLGNNYAKRVVEVGGTPFCLAPVDNWLTREALDLCDGFVVQGGAEFYPYHFQVIHHAITHKKRYLGICLGQQLIYVYFELLDRIKKEGYTGDPVVGICDYLSSQGPDFSVQLAIPNHRMPYPARGQEDAAKHDVDVVKGTLLYRVLGSDKMRLCSFHNLNTPPSQTKVTANAWSSLGDGVLEGTEYQDYILGVQGHPEVDSQLNKLFEFVVND